MRCFWTISGQPFAGRIGIDLTILTGRIIYNIIARITLINNNMTPTSIKHATFLGHKNAFSPDFDGLTRHEKLPFLSINSPYFLEKKLLHIARTFPPGVEKQLLPGFYGKALNIRGVS